MGKQYMNLAEKDNPLFGELMHNFTAVNPAVVCNYSDSPCMRSKPAAG
jgi:hypothetical protein